ncbi:MAG: preprotein translocase subunit SecY [Verrucomicrobiia bacterium]
MLRFRNSLKIPELRHRILFTLALVVVVRVGAAIPCPGINVALLREYFQTIVSNQSAGTVVGLVNIFSGGALENCAIFSLGIMPYISASIMLQLMTVVMPRLGKLAREEGGRQKLNQYTRYLTLVLCLLQGYLLALGFQNPGKNPFLTGITDVIQRTGMELVPDPGWRFIFYVVLVNMTGTMILTWLGEQITDRGIGNGISLIIAVGIVARLPAALAQGWQKFIPTGASSEQLNPLLLVLLLAFMFAVIAGVVAVTEAVRKITVQYAKRMVGRKMYGGQSSYLPLKVNYSGVMPIIFAQTILMFPNFLLSFVPDPSPIFRNFIISLQQGSLHYALYGGMILFFSYFWVATQFNPIQIADDLKKHGGFIPGIRPGQPTAEFLDYTMTRLTLAGAIFLTVLAVLPQMLSRMMGIPYLTASFFGGTSLLIIVGVMLDAMRQIETFLLQRHYDGFLKKGRLKGRSAVPLASGSYAASSDAVIWLWVAIGLLVIIWFAASLV